MQSFYLDIELLFFENLFLYSKDWRYNSAKIRKEKNAQSHEQTETDSYLTSQSIANAFRSIRR